MVTKPATNPPPSTAITNPVANPRRHISHPPPGPSRQSNNPTPTPTPTPPQPSQTPSIPINKLNENLILAIQNNDSIKAKQWLNQGADPNAINEAGGTPLMAAARKGNVAIVNLLLGKNVDVNVQNKFGMTALIAACEGEHIDVVETLLYHSADVNLATIHGETALSVAKSKGNDQLMEMLTSAGANK